MAQSNKKKIVIEGGAKPLKFDVGIADFNKMQNDMLPTNKVAPAENFLMACIDPSQKDYLVELFDQGLGLDLANIVGEQFKPAMVFTVKK